MSKRYTEEYKNTIIELYNSGKTLAELNSEYGLPKSTILTWVKKAEPIAVDNNKTITQADYQAMLKKMARIEEENIQDYFNVDSKIKADFALQVKGESMIKACIFDGDEATLKRFYKTQNDIKLFAENDSEAYRINWPKTIMENELRDGFRILGKLVGVYSNREHK